MISDSLYQKAIDLINKSETVLITTHIRPDGDACGCMTAMDDVLTDLGKKTKMLLLSSVPEWYEFIFTEKVPVLGDDVGLEQLMQGKFADPDLVIIVDTNSNTQLPKFDKYLKQAGKPILVIDHHVTADGLGDVEIVEQDAAATALVVLDFFRYAKWPITEKIAEALFVAAATDTGWFQFNNTDSAVFRGCAEFIEAGADPAQIYYNLYQNFSYPRFKLMTAMFNNLELHLDGRFAMQHILMSDFKEAGAAHNDTENLIDECRRIRTIESSALLVELEDGRIRCSLRSRGAVDVGQIAEGLGGGGHKMAAGAIVDGPLQQIKERILDEITQQFESLNSD